MRVFAAGDSGAVSKLVITALAIAAASKALVGLVAGFLHPGELQSPNSAGIAGWLPWIVSVRLLWAAVGCWARRGDGHLGIRLAALWALVAACYANRALRDSGVRTLEIGWLLVPYLVYLVSRRSTWRVARSEAIDFRVLAFSIACGIVTLPLLLLTTPGASVVLACIVVYGLPWIGSGASQRIMRAGA